MQNTLSIHSQLYYHPDGMEPPFRCDIPSRALPANFLLKLSDLNGAELFLGEIPPPSYKIIVSNLSKVDCDRRTSVECGGSLVYQEKVYKRLSPQDAEYPLESLSAVLPSGWYGTNFFRDTLLSALSGDSWIKLSDLDISQFSKVQFSFPLS